MRFQTQIRKIPTASVLLGTLAAAALTACGGSGGYTAATTTVNGTVKDSSSGTAIVGATVQVTNTTGTAASTTSTSTGYSLTVDTATINTTSNVVVTVSATGYQTCTMTLTGLSSAGGTTAASGCTTLTAITTNEFYPTEGALVTRVGDGQAPGTTNSQLQVVWTAATTPKPEFKTIKLGSPTTALLSGYAAFTVYAQIRGMEASSCADKVTVFQGTSDDPTTARFAQAWTNASATYKLNDSDVQGALTPYTFKVPTASLTAAGGDLYVKIETGTCVNGTAADPKDDFEFTGVHAAFTAS